jgi:SAM-dependent methyltransferase
MSKHKTFWNKEYQTAAHFALSMNPSEDLEKFCRFLERGEGKKSLNVTMKALDIGCGNGRNLFYLADTYGVRGIGRDISDEAIKQAKIEEAKRGYPEGAMDFKVGSIEDPIDLPDKSVKLVLDMMVSHFLREEGRKNLKKEVLRVLKPGGWYFFKTFLADEDQNVERLLREFPADEPGSYIHPRMGVYEHVYSEAEIYEFFEPEFTIHKIERSYRHVTTDGRAHKRRTMSVYMQKNIYAED